MWRAAAVMLLAMGCGEERVDPTVLCGGEAGPCVDVRFVAHQDDDLLFMNPDVAASIARGNRVVTVFVTAGTADDAARMAQRERGILNAYAFMVDPSFAATDTDGEASMLAHWTLHEGAPIELALAGGTRRALQYDLANVSVVFLRVVEQSAVDLKALVGGTAGAVSTVPDATLDVQTYRLDELADTLEAIIERFDDHATALAVGTLDATQLHHLEEDYGLGYVDHADHVATATLAVDAYVRHLRRPTTGARTLVQYRAYNTGQEEPNIGGEVRGKRRVFYRYVALGEGLSALDDGGNLIELTNRDPDDPHFPGGTYEAWTERRYALPSLSSPSGTLALASGCLVGNALGPCEGAPSWELGPRGELRPVGDPSSCVVLDTASLAPCPAIPDAFVLTSTGQIRTRGAACLEVDTTGVRAAPCTMAELGRAVERQRWTWTPSAPAMSPATAEASSDPP